jgi:hypothetical protein
VWGIVAVAIVAVPGRTDCIEVRNNTGSNYRPGALLAGLLGE